MRITKVDVLRLLGGDRNTYVFCRVHTDAGIYGDGEVAGICGSRGAFGVVTDLARFLINEDPMDNERLWEKMYKESFWGQNGGPMTFAGMSALDIALWDIKGKALGVPCHTLLGGKTRDKLRTYASQLQLGWFPIYSQDASMNLATLEQYRAVTKTAMDEGYDSVKFDFLTFDTEGKRIPRASKNGILPQKYVDLVESRIAAVRETAGNNVDIIVENHSKIDALGALQIAKAVEKYRVMYFEEPNTPSPYTAAFLSSRINMPIAAGERIYSRWQFIPYFENRSIQVIQPDIANCGGLTEVKKICDMAHAYDIVAQIHTCGSPLQTSIAMQLEAAIPNFCIHEHHKRVRTKWMEGLTKHNPHPVDGYLAVPDEPGIGNEIMPLAYERADEIKTIQ